ncbi:MAG: septation ring formation regulator EzrA [Streptococcaceae bacterium]|jgi:septation ring formation regulator|nr:septation ring formation regulator EzrA [Streptococcaceae bacterium]
MANIIIIIIIVVVILAAAAYGFSMIMRRRTEGQIIALEERKEALFDLPVQDEFDKVKAMHLIGQSQKIYREWHQKWVDLSQNSFADLENEIFEAEQLNDSFRWSKAKVQADEAESQIEMMENDADRIRQGLNELMEQERHNSTKIQDALDLYDRLRTHIADTAEQYGSAIGMIEESLASIEAEFNQFVELNSKGDPVEAAEILGIAEDHTVALDNITQRIPEIIRLVDEEYEGKINELEAAHEDYIGKGYIFPSTFNLEQTLAQVRSKLKETKENLERFELDHAEALLEEVKKQIDGLYDIFTKEYRGRKYFERNSEKLMEYIDHTRENNRTLLLEIDKALQNYVLPNNEKGTVRTFQVRLDDLEKDATEILKIKAEAVKKEPYSMLNRQVTAIISALQEIESTQITINTKISNLASDEKKAKEDAIEIDTRLKMIKRFVEKQGLPGLPDDYLDNFMSVNSQVDKLYKELEKLHLNMEAIHHMISLAKERLENLKDSTDKLLDNAALAEQLMQYANRYKNMVNPNGSPVAPGISDSINRAWSLFERYDYIASFNSISAAIDAVEPGVTARTVKVYHEQKQNPEYRM